MQIPDNFNPNSDFIEELDQKTILDDEVFYKIFEIEDQLERQRLINDLRQKARKLGRIRDFDSTLKVFQTDFAQKFKQHGSNLIDFTDSPLPGLKSGKWTANDKGVTRTEIMGGFTPVTVVACPHPIQPVERLVNIEDDTEKITIAFFKDFKWKNVTVERAVCANKTHIVGLSNRGIEVNTENAKELVKYLADIVSLNMQEIPVYKGISRLGWIEDTFVPYQSEIKYDGDLDFKVIFDSIETKGDYALWEKACKKLRKNVYLRMVMAASFASPLLEKIGALPFILHLWGGTGTGKTVALMVAMSIWGNPDMGKLVRTLNMTVNAMSRTASFLYNVPFAGDELQIIKSKWENFDTTIMRITEGIDRGRAKSYGGVEALKTWKNAFIFTGEEPITKAESGGGAKNRVIEIECTQKVIEDGNAVANFMRDNYGHAGRELVSIIAGNDYREEFGKIFKEIMDTCDTTEKQAMAMACILIGDKIAAENIFKEKPLQIKDVEKFLTNAKDVDIAYRAYDWILNWIAKNEIRFQKDNGGETWGKIEEQEGYAMINKDVLTEYLSSAGFDYTAVISKFAERGQIAKNSQGWNVHQTRVYGIKASYIKLLFTGENDPITCKDEEVPF